MVLERRLLAVPIAIWSLVSGSVGKHRVIAATTSNNPRDAGRSAGISRAHSGELRLMPLVMRCDAPGCESEKLAAITPSGRVYADGWWYVRGDGKGVCGCSDAHFSQAMAIPAQKAA